MFNLITGVVLTAFILFVVFILIAFIVTNLIVLPHDVLMRRELIKVSDRLESHSENYPEKSQDEHSKRELLHYTKGLRLLYWEKFQLPDINRNASTKVQLLITAANSSLNVISLFIAVRRWIHVKTTSKDKYLETKETA